jgi:hypothetical protein
MRFPYWQLMGPDVLIIAVVDIDPLIGELGFEGAIATMGLA